MEVGVLRFAAIGGLVLAMAAGPASAQEALSAGDLLKDPAVKAAIDAAKATEAQTIADQIRFCEIPAPSFKEEVRGQELKRVFDQLGLQNVRVDKVGNVLGEYPGAAARPHVVIAAHLDTVFPEGTDVKVKRSGTRLSAPGIGDDTRALALLLTVVRAMNAAKFETASDILFVGNVGEEGEGDLRGVKYLLQKGKYKGRIQRFISIDGGDQGSITNEVRHFLVDCLRMGGTPLSTMADAVTAQKMIEAAEESIKGSKVVKL